MQNPDLLQILVEKTSNKRIVESASDRLWGTGVPLAREGCLDKEMWITPGILGELLMEVRENQTMFSQTIPVNSYPTTHTAAKTSIGVTNTPLLGVTPSDIPATSDMMSSTNMLPTTTSSPSTALPANTTVSIVEIAVSQAADTGTTQLPTDYPSAIPESINAERQIPSSPSTAAEASAMETT